MWRFQWRIFYNESINLTFRANLFSRIPTMMENDANENPLMLNPFEFVNRIITLKVGFNIIYKYHVVIVKWVVLKFNYSFDVLLIVGFGRKRRISQELVPLEVLTLLQICQEVFMCRNVPSPPNTICNLNNHKRKNLEALFGFIFAYLVLSREERC